MRIEYLSQVVRQGNRAYSVSPINQQPQRDSTTTGHSYEPPSSLVREGNRAIPCQTIYEDSDETEDNEADR